MRKPINVSIEKFVEHKTAKWQGIVFMANDRVPRPLLGTDGRQRGSP